MENSQKAGPYSAFAANGFRATIEERIEVIQTVYQSDPIPWVVGYSGGKDSTATLQLIWIALSKLAPQARHKKVYVISTDTLVENPIVAHWVTHSLEVMAKAAKVQELPIEPNRLMPEVKDRFWVNLIGKGYPAPRPKFRWCTSRLKINPSNTFIKNLERQNGEAIVVLGTRKSESAPRAASMKRHAKSTRQWLSRNGQLDRSWVFTPIEDWSNDDVWQFLMQEKNPWGYNNKDLLGMYQGATADGECPLVVDSSTPSCGDSRFGCYVCTMVTQDKSMQAMIQNDSEKEWMLPLLELRNKYLDTTTDRKHRDFRRMDGRLTLMEIKETRLNEVCQTAEVWDDKQGKYVMKTFQLVHGPYKQKYRETLLRQLLIAQKMVNERAPEDVRFSLYTLEDLEEIRRIWVLEKHEIEDRVPAIYEEVFGEPYICSRLDDNQVFNTGDIELLRQMALVNEDEDELHFALMRELLSVEIKYQHAARRAGLFDELNEVLEFSAFKDEKEALDFAVRRMSAFQKADEKPVSEPEFIRRVINILPVDDETSELQHDL
jgi:DNA sulfur modification protein DndC